ncbi:MAG: hypothetical protein HRF48_18295 [Chloroflexota bacterium]|jgi:hypothetical protein
MLAEIVLRYWQGRGPLWKVFWVYGVLTSAVVTALFMLLVRLEGDGFGLHQLLMLLFVPYTVWILVSVWRCAFNTENAYYGYLARAMTVAWAVNAALLVLFVELDLLF